MDDVEGPVKSLFPKPQSRSSLSSGSRPVQQPPRKAPPVGMRRSDTSAQTVVNDPFKVEVRQKKTSNNKKWIILSIAIVVISVLSIILYFATRESESDINGFQSRNYSHTLRQNLNPFQSWSTSQHESQTYQYPKNIPVFKPMHGDVTKYMYTKNPNFD